MRNITEKSFMLDKEKMHDFLTMGMESFLGFYSYLDEEDYFSTYHDIMSLVFTDKKRTLDIERVKPDDIMRIYEQSGGAWGGYHYTKTSGIEALQKMCGQTICDVKYYAITDKDEAINWACGIVAMSNIDKALHPHHVKLAETIIEEVA